MPNNTLHVTVGAVELGLVSVGLAVSVFATHRSPAAHELCR
jgi:hypothetical protein